MNRTQMLFVLGIFLFPQFAFGAWWNPLSWRVIKHTNAPTSAPVNTYVPIIPVQTKAVATSPTAVATNEKLYDVVRVIDGDTVSINMNGKVEIIRLIGINTPETVDPRKTVECFGIEASNKAKELLSGKRVRIETDTTQDKRDKYNRLLAYVYREDGLFFNKYMIENGYAYEYTYHLPYKYQSEFKSAQKSAQANVRGLWAPGVCVNKVTQPVVKSTYLTPTVQPAVQSLPSNIICSYNTYNCTDFSTHAEAQAVYEACGGVNNDIHKLDQDKDGLACETLP